MLPKLKQYHAINQRIHIKKITIHTPEGISNPNQSNNPSPISITTFSTKKTSPFLIKIAQKLFPQLKTSQKKKTFHQKKPQKTKFKKEKSKSQPQNPHQWSELMESQISMFMVQSGPIKRSLVAFSTRTAAFSTRTVAGPAGAGAIPVNMNRNWKLKLSAAKMTFLWE